nr:transposase [Streptomyces tendae]
MRQAIGGRPASAAERVGKRANCQVAVSDYAANDTASCPWEWQLHLPREWTNEPDRACGAGASWTWCTGRSGVSRSASWTHSPNGT